MLQNESSAPSEMDQNGIEEKALLIPYQEIDSSYLSRSRGSLLRKPGIWIHLFLIFLYTAVSITAVCAFVPAASERRHNGKKLIIRNSAKGY